MHRILVSALALALLLGAGAAMAQQATGTVESVDPSHKTVVINGQPYMIEGQAAGLKIDRDQGRRQGDRPVRRQHQRRLPDRSRQMRPAGRIGPVAGR